MDDQDKHIHDAEGVCLTFKSRHDQKSDGHMLDLRVFATAGRIVYFNTCDNNNNDMYVCIYE